MIITITGKPGSGKSVVKKSQISVFILIGIILVIIFSLLFYLVYNVEIPKTEVVPPFEKSVVKSFVQDCIDKTSRQALILIGQQGGHIFKPEKRINVGNFFIAYDFYEDENFLPNKEKIEQDISKYVEETLNDCVGGLKSFKSDFEFGEINVGTNINKNNVIIDVDYPITIISLDKQEQVDAFKTRIPVRLDYILEVSNQIINQEITNPNWINISFLRQIDLEAEIYPYGETSNIYVLTDHKSNNYTFVFANKFKSNLPPHLMAFGTKEVKLGEELKVYAYAIDPDEDEITYTGSALLEINKKTGLIKFKPTIKRDYKFIIKAADLFGNYDEEELLIKVR